MTNGPTPRTMRRLTRAATLAETQDLRQPVRPRKPQAPGPSEFPFVIVTGGPNNEADFTDHRYWCARAYPSNMVADPIAAIQWTAYAAPHDLRLIVPATNLLEASSSSHNLSAGTVVMLSAAYDRCIPQILRYWFCAGGASADAWIRIESVSGSSFPRTYTAKKYVNGAVTGAARAAFNHAESMHLAAIINSYGPVEVGQVVPAIWVPSANRYEFNTFGDFDAVTNCPGT